MKRFVGTIAVVTFLALAAPLHAADPEPIPAPSAGSIGGRIMPALFFDLVCAGATKACTLLNPSFGGTTTITSGGRLILDNGTELLPAMGFAASPLRGYWFNSANNRLVINGDSNNSTVAFDTLSVFLGSTQSFGWASTANPETNTLDVSLFRDAADTLAQRRGTTPQVFRLYKSFTDASNGSWFTIDTATTANAVYLGTRFNGTGTRTLPVMAGSFVKALSAASATNVVAFSTSATGECGGSIYYGVHATDGTERQYRSGRVQFQMVNKSGSATCVVSGFDGTVNPTELKDGSSVAQSSASTLTYTWGQAAGCTFTLNAVSGLVETTLEIRYRVVMHESAQSGACLASPQ